MSGVAERKTSILFESYMAAYLSGSAPQAEDYLARCQEAERERLRDAIAGFLFAYENQYSCEVSEHAVRSAMERLQRVRERKRVLAEAKARTATISWDQAVTQPLLCLANVLYPPSSIHAEPAIAVMNRSSNMPPPTHTVLDEWAKQAAERFAQWEAERLLSRVGITEAPVPLDRVAEQLCLLVQEAPLKDVEGCLITNGETGGILLNSLMANARRKRYTLAHEIGHFIMHRRSRPHETRPGELDAVSNKESQILHFNDKATELFNPKSRQEFEASAFASYLLMPPSLLPRNFGRLLPSLEMARTVSEQFDVSLLAVLRRLVRESHYRTVLICSEGGRVKWTDYSPEAEGFNKAVTNVPAGSAAHELVQHGSTGTNTRLVPARVWFERGEFVRDGTMLSEESQHFDTGYTYTLFNVSEAS